ncbi:MAG: BPSL0067 family protein [Pseudomonadota bacterium]
MSYVKKVCPSLPPTHLWRKGDQVRNSSNIVPGTVIATFDSSDHFHGHAAIYVNQNGKGINVIDQYVTGNTPKPVSGRLIHWEWPGVSNNGDKYYVVE